VRHLIGDLILRYVSTRGDAPILGFSEVLLAGLARDGGLYVPETWPTLTPATIAGFAGQPYSEVAFRVMHPFIDPEISQVDLRRIIDEAYSVFRHPAVTPLIQIAPNHFIMELFHGPTLAFKDVAMQFLSRVMDYVLERRGERATIVGATSGDTGGAAIEAFRGRERTDIFILFPKGRVSPVQQRQMTTVDDPNVHALAVEGTFDDAQAIVKGMFNHFSFRDRVSLSGINSINWARIVAQVVYYFVAGATLGAPYRPVSFTVPTGNFGDIFAAYVAMRMGLPIRKLVIATNVNDILARTVATGTYDVREVVPTSSPSMDIQVASNFERLLFEVYGRDSGAVRGLMASLAQSRQFVLSAPALAAIRSQLSAGRADEEETAAAIRTMLRETGELLDPHTAVAVAVAEKEPHDPSIPMIVLGTAHAAKFPDAVEAACGVRPALPDWLEDITRRSERATPLPVDQRAVETHILSTSRAAREGAVA
jgi:threonine synthase